MGRVLLAEELTLIAVDPDSGRHSWGTRDQLNACLAGLLVAEAVLEGAAVAGPKQATVVASSSSPVTSPVLAAAVEVIAERGPKVKAILSAMSRGLDARLGEGTWDALVSALESAGVLQPREGVIPRSNVVDVAARDAVVERLRIAAASNEPLEPRTALVLSMTGPANLLEVVAPERGAARKHARRRIDHALEASQLQPIGEAVRRLLAEAAAAAAAGATIAASAAVGGDA